MAITRRSDQRQMMTSPATGEDGGSSNTKEGPVIPGERASTRIKSRQSNATESQRPYGGKIDSGFAGVKALTKSNPNNGVRGNLATPMSKSFKEQKSLSYKSPSTAVSQQSKDGVVKTTKRKANDDVSQDDTTNKRRTRTGRKSSTSLFPSQDQAAQIAAMTKGQPKGPAAPSKVRKTLGVVLPDGQARGTEQVTRKSKRMLDAAAKDQPYDKAGSVGDIHLRGVNGEDVAMSPRRSPSPPSCVAVAEDVPASTNSQTVMPSASLLPKTLRTETQAEHTSEALLSSPLSELPSEFYREPTPEFAVANKAVLGLEATATTNMQDLSSQAPNELSLLRATAVASGPSWKLPAVPVQTSKAPEVVTKMSRTRRSVKPIERFGTYVAENLEYEGDSETIIVSSNRTAEVTTDDNASMYEILEQDDDGFQEFSLTRSFLAAHKTIKKRKSSALHDGGRGSGFAGSDMSKKRKGEVQQRRESDDSVITLKISPEKLKTAILEVPRRKSAAVSMVESTTVTTAKQPHSLPSPSITSISDDAEEDSLSALHASQEILDLSSRLTGRVPVCEKPSPQGQPEVWADSRQSLCETVPYFKMPQSGCHQNNGHVYAFLYDGVGHCREYMDTDIIIARAGGGMEADANGQMQQKKDHSLEESQVQAVLNDIEHQNPVVIICGNKNAGAICKMPHRYCVLGWYKPVAVWSEKTMGKGNKTWTTIKYRFERLNADGDTKTAWYAPIQEVVTDEDRTTAGPLSRQTCRDCNIASPHVYLNGWMCLNSACTRFWKLYCGEDAPYGKLHYNPAFLLDRTSWENEEEPYSAKPLIPDSGKVVGDNLSKINTRGIVCPKCGRCNPRRLWRGWTCDNPVCDFQNFPKHIPVRPAMLHQPWDNVGIGPTLSQNKYAKHLGVKVQVSHKLGFKVFTYTFDGIDGKLVHAVSNAKINGASGGPDAMFEAMQKQDDPEMNLHLERRPFIGTGAASSLKIKPTVTAAVANETPDAESILLALKPGTEVMVGVKTTQIAPADDALNDTTGLLNDLIPTQDDNDDDEDFAIETQPLKTRPGRPSTAGITETTTSPTEPGDLMTAFSVNYGMPYKFVAGGSSLPFSESPWPVRACRADLNWASQNFSPSSSVSTHTDFNEQLIFAYMEGQKVEYHDDGESGLGPRIASMSLGSKAKMMLRMKGKHHVGCSKTGVFVVEKPVPGGIGGKEMYEKRIAAWEELQELKDDKRAYEKRRKELPKEIGIFEKRTKKAEDLVTITLNHGDIVLMEGYEIQQYLEHKVVPEGCLRFALTCRTVLPEHLKPEEKPSYGVEPDQPEMSSLVRMAKAEAVAALEEAASAMEVVSEPSGEASTDLNVA
ncbi:Putative alpha-ketoglutarate-dependent dioxygenase AlkB, DNA oxidative demethylase ALKBH2 [Septoria linicola]|uniref:Alpha-ketoglutarate-dependent dioxygenase AlkB, DNA oxidative demethylase ALKBH2 n=1 Tax=Septoria linicola TaxID=215465 RepID=A0A9Q9AYB7_9PEZI|nr:Putative alpha-ketoglutarate-dependent dioxygenase AlkB, DNA oxidative demethylase ALKBH2 [Septoria linicola]